MLFATSNPGKLLRLSPARADRGTYTSDVRDAQTVATWGTIKWQAPAPAGTTRRDLHALGQHAHAGRNVERLEPPPTPIADGSPITSPRARYLQWRAVLDRRARRVAAADLGDRGLPAAQHCGRA